MGSYIYRKILRKLDLTKEQLFELEKALSSNNICYGPFLRDSKMCPTTKALSIKLASKKFGSNEDVRNQLKKIGISKPMLFGFYLTFDLPSMLSRRIFERNLKQLRIAVRKLLGSVT